VEGLEVGKERKEVDLYRECSEEKQHWQHEADTCQEFNVKLPTISDILLGLIDSWRWD
jgi:hypothetical protein